MRADQTRPAPLVNTYDSNLISTITVTLVVQFLCDFLISEDRITDSFHTSLNKKKSSQRNELFSHNSSLSFSFSASVCCFAAWTRRRPGEQNQLRVETFLSPGWKNLNEHQLWSRRQAEHQRRTSLRERFSSLVLFYQSFCLLYLYLLSSQPSIVLRCLPVSLCRSLLFIFLI